MTNSFPAFCQAFGPAVLNRARSLDGSHITLFGLNLSCLQKGQATPFRSLHKQNETNEIRFGRGSPPLKPLHKWSQISNCPKITQPLTTTETTIGPPTRERRGSTMKQAVWLHIPGCCPPTLPTLLTLVQTSDIDIPSHPKWST